MIEVLEEVQIYCKCLYKIQDYMLLYLNDANDQDNLIKLFQEIDNLHIVESEEFLDQFLRFLAIIGLYHRQTKNLYPKINRIINEYKNLIKQNYSNEEIFSIFRHNEPIILFLAKEKIFQFDNDIKNILDNEDHQEQRDFFFSGDESTEEYKEQGRNHTQLCQIIRADSLEEFIPFIEQNNVQLGSNISPSIYETNFFLREHKDTSLIQYAAFQGSSRIFKHIVEKQPDFLNKTVWEFAFYGENKEIIEFIEKSSTEAPDDNFQSCLLNSIYSHSNDTFELIQNRFEKKETKNDNNDNNDNYANIKKDRVLRASICAFNFRLIAKSLDIYINVSSLTKYNERRFLTMLFKKACKASFHKIVESLLLFPNVDVNYISRYSALQYACINGDVILVRMLLTDPSIQVNKKSMPRVRDLDEDYEGYTTLELAIRYGHNKIVLLLLSNANIDVNLKSMWLASSPLLIAARFNNVAAVKYLLTFDRIDVNACSNQKFSVEEDKVVDGGETPLHFACKYNRIEIVKLLLESPNISLDIKNWEDKVPADVTDNQEILSLLNDN